ncbi:C40 family peptidase [Maribacter sp. CXY002]|uniref:C40 family peptidase n=1 Tax=Maribacter luteocoastalis TaxID=3407671 RepID=UPI003B682F28
MYFRKLTIVLVTLLFIGCKTTTNDLSEVQEIIDRVQLEYAPDKRIALFAIEASKQHNNYTLKGESNLPEAVAKLRKDLLDATIKIIDSIQVLPAVSLGDRTNGLVTISVANLRSNPKHSAELATQATLGTPLKIWKKEGDWYYIQTPDNYLAWVDAGGITPVEDDRLKQWKQNDKIIYTKTYGHAFLDLESKERVSDLVAGSVLEIVNYGDNAFQVKFPDGRQAFVLKEDAEVYDTWLENLKTKKEDLVSTSKTFMGVPYLWGGTSTKGMDCSGFTKTVYFLNGMIIPRDASQQVHTGKPIDSTRNFDALEKGDLLFFGRKATDSTAEKVVHVGMWIGNNEYIHASEMVRISSMDKNASNFDEYNYNRYLRSNRMLNEEDEALINLQKSFTFNNAN